MKQTIFQTLILLTIPFSCSKEKNVNNSDVGEGIGTVWLSGGLAFCAEQIRMENGDTLIPVNSMEIYHYISGQKISLKYSEITPRESGCNIGKDCEIIEIKLIE